MTNGVETTGCGYCHDSQANVVRISGSYGRHCLSTTVESSTMKYTSEFICKSGKSVPLRVANYVYNSCCAIVFSNAVTQAGVAVAWESRCLATVSYTHLTLPTKA